MTCGFAGVSGSIVTLTRAIARRTDEQRSCCIPAAQSVGCRRVRVAKGTSKTVIGFAAERLGLGVPTLQSPQVRHLCDGPQRVGVGVAEDAPPPRMRCVEERGRLCHLSL